jgi:hypothetical protein
LLPSESLSLLKNSRDDCGANDAGAKGLLLLAAANDQ